MFDGFSFGLMRKHYLPKIVPVVVDVAVARIARKTRAYAVSDNDGTIHLPNGQPG